MRRHFVAAIIAALTLLPTTAHAETQRGNPTAQGTLSGDGRLVVAVSDATPGEPARTPLIGYITYKVTTDDHPDPGDLSGLCLADPQAHTFGWWYRIIGTTLDGRVVIDELVCRPFDATHHPHPPALPRPPTIEEAWNAANVPAPRILTDPPTRGITGLTTHITPSSPAVLSIAATIRGYTIVGTATLDHFLVAIDGGPPQTTTDITFTTKGEHTIVIAAIWRGRATLAGPGLDHAISIGDIGIAMIGASRRYPLHEVRTALQP